MATTTKNNFSSYGDDPTYSTYASDPFLTIKKQSENQYKKDMSTGYTGDSKKSFFENDEEGAVGIANSTTQQDKYVPIQMNSANPEGEWYSNNSNNAVKGSATNDKPTDLNGPYTITVNKGTHVTTVTGSGIFAKDSTTTISATEFEIGYEFDKWDDGDTNATRSITVTEDKTYTALAKVKKFTITVSAGTNVTSVSGSGTFDYGTQVNIQATQFTEGYKFDKWDDGDTNATRTITVTEDKTYTASANIKTFTVTASSNNTAYGTVAPATSTVNYGSDVTITATVIDTHTVSNWNVNGTATGSTATTYTLTSVKQDTTIEAIFA